MPMYSKILVPVDFSSHSRAALVHALELASHFDASVDVLHVAEIPAFRTDPSIATAGGAQTLRDYALADANGELQAFLESSNAGARAKLSRHVETGKPRDVILEHARRGSY